MRMRYEKMLMIKVTRQNVKRGGGNRMFYMKREEKEEKERKGEKNEIPDSANPNSLPKTPQTGYACTHRARVRMGGIHQY